MPRLSPSLLKTACRGQPSAAQGLCMTLRIPSCACCAQNSPCVWPGKLKRACAACPLSALAELAHVSLQRSAAWRGASPELQPARAKGCNVGRPCLHAAVLSPAGRHPSAAAPRAQPEGLAPAPLRAGPGCRGFVQEIPCCGHSKRGRMDRHTPFHSSRVDGDPPSLVGRQCCKLEASKLEAEPEKSVCATERGARPADTSASVGRMLSSCAHGNAWASVGLECACHHPFTCSQPQRRLARALPVARCQAGLPTGADAQPHAAEHGSGARASRRQLGASLAGAAGLALLQQAPVR